MDSLYTIEGSLEELNSLYLNEQFIGLNNEDITLTDLEISSTYDVSYLNTLDGYTSGTINAGTVTAISGSLSDLLTSYQSSGVSNLGNEEITLLDTTSVEASDLAALAALNSSGTVEASSVATITGTAAEIIAAFADSTITEASDVALTVNSWRSDSNSGEKS